MRTTATHHTDEVLTRTLCYHTARYQHCGTWQPPVRLTGQQASRFAHTMTSIKDRIAAFNKGGGSPAPAPAPVAKSDPPMGDVIHSGLLGKAGSGILSATFQKRFCALHVDGTDWWLSPYENEELTKLKGSRYSLNEGGVTCNEDKIDLTAWLGPPSSQTVRGDGQTKAASTVERKSGRSASPWPSREHLPRQVSSVAHTAPPASAPPATLRHQWHRTARLPLQPRHQLRRLRRQRGHHSF